MNQEKAVNTEDQKSQSIDASKLETQPIQKEKETDISKEQAEENSVVHVLSTEKESASDNEKPKVQ